MQPTARCLLRTKAARYLGVSPRTFDALVHRAEVRGIPVPGHRRLVFDRSDLDAVLHRWKSPAAVSDVA